MLSIAILLSSIAMVSSLDSGGSCQIACSQKFGADVTSEAAFACTRGCRFSAINQFLSLARPDEQSNSECEKNCKTAYADDKLLRSCNYGCNNQGVLSPLGQMLETQPNFGADPLLSPATFFDAVSSFIDDFSKAVSNRVPMSNQESGMVMRPIGVVRVISHNFPDSPQSRLISVKLSSNNGGFGSIATDDFFNSNPFREMIDNDDSSSEFVHDQSDTGFIVKPMASNAAASASRCLAPTYSSIPGPKCRAYMPRYQFNKQTGTCEQFIYGGCGAVDNIFSSFDECQSLCSQFANGRNDDRSGRSFELWLLTFSFGALGLCALMGAVFSACLYCCRRRRQRTQAYIQNDTESKIFLVAPQLAWSKDAKVPMMAMPPTYEQVLAASAPDQQKLPEANISAKDTISA